MKRTTIILSLIFALAIALSVSIPTLALSASGTTTINGNLATKLEITAPSAMTLTLDSGATAINSSTTPGYVRSNKAWTLVVTDKVNGGLMKSVAAPTTALGTKFQINVEGAGLRDADTLVPTVTGAATASKSISFAVSQVVLWTDTPATDYRIIIDFTVTN